MPAFIDTIENRIGDLGGGGSNHSFMVGGAL